METTRTIRPRRPQNGQFASVPSRASAATMNDGHATKIH
jgi:hypothetical protein